MIDIREHGGAFGGNGSVGKFVKVTVHDTQPQNPEKYDIWIKSSDYNTINFLYQTEDVANVGDIKVTKSDLTPNLKGSIEGLGKKITYTYVPEDVKPKLYDTKYFELYATLGVVFKKLASTMETLEAYWFDGVTWKQFSFSNTEIVGTEGTNLYAYNYNLEQVRKSVTLNGTITNMSIDKQRKLIFAWVVSTKTFYKLDFSLTVLEEYIFSGTITGDMAQVIESKKVAIFVSGAYIYFYDYTTGTKIKEYYYSLVFRYYSVIYDEVYDRLLMSFYRNGSAGSYIALDYTTNTLYKTWISGTFGPGMALSKDGNFVYVCYLNGSYSYIAKYNRSDLTLVTSYQIGGSSANGPIFVDDNHLYLMGYQTGSSAPAEYRKYPLDDYTAYIWTQSVSYYYGSPARNGVIGTKPVALTSNNEIYISAIHTGNGVDEFYILDADTNTVKTDVSLGLDTVGNYIFALSGESF